MTEPTPELLKFIHDAPRDKLEAAFVELLMAAMVMQESEAATTRWLKKNLGAGK